MIRRKPLSASAEAFLAEPLVATLTTIRPDGSLHAAPVRFTWDGDAGLARVMTVLSSRKARNLAVNPGSRVALCQVDGFRWITLEGTATVSGDAREVAEGVSRYTRRYQSPPPHPPGRVVVTIAVDGVMTLNI
ncbi:pyridoxamine 5'-phosphate oxidase family protein [Nocardia asteroides]